MVSTQSPIVRYYFKQDQAIYAIPFAYQLTAELHVYLIDDESNRTDLVENIDYTVTAQSITLLSPASFSAYFLIIQREGDVVQDMVLDNGFYVDVKKIEEALDTMTMRLQEMKLALQNTLKNPWEDWDQDTDIMLPPIDKRKEGVLYFGPDGVTMKSMPWKDVADIQADVHETQEKADAAAKLAERYAAGTENGKPVSSGEGFENNAKYWRDKTVEAGTSAISEIETFADSKQTELDDHVKDTLKPSLDAYVADKKEELDDHTAEKKTELDNYVNQTSKPAIDTYVGQTSKAEIDDYVAQKQTAFDTHVADKVDEADQAIDNKKTAAIAQIQAIMNSLILADTEYETL